MKILLLALIIAILFSLLYLPFIIRAYARFRANKIIQGKRPSTEKRINRCISILTWTNDWITGRKEPDDLRIKRLHNMLNETQKPHG
ncbi:hypothetical protein KA005_46670 [bacterium]|nr:hypothetical protein [bacterium]